MTPLPVKIIFLELAFYNIHFEKIYQSRSEVILSSRCRKIGLSAEVKYRTVISKLDIKSDVLIKT